MIKTLTPHSSSVTASLRQYFRSGWAFLIPYLAAYLLYWWLRWPVNAVAGEGPVKVASLPSVASAMGGESGALPHPPALSGVEGLVPSLLHLYWALHAINVVLAAIALVAWLRERRRVPIGDEGVAAPVPPQAGGVPVSDPRPAPVRYRPGDRGPPSLSLSLSLKIAPWLLLALLFYIPGVYLEWPADPWEHYRRINEWMTHDVADGFSAGYKSSYFFAYSLLGQISPPTRQLFWLDFYYTGACLLLCWQYYRLARAVGLGERASMLFVILQTVLFGNNIFGFYRYYGISSTVFSQLEAIALIRIAIEALKAPEQWARSKVQGDFFSFTPSFPRFLTPLFSHSLITSLSCAALLLPLIAFNHIQGIGIAGLGLAAVIIWRLIEWRRSMVWWLAATAIVLSVAAVLWWPRNPTVDRDYVPQGWFTAWYGFNLLSPSSPAFDRTVTILGIFGVVNLLAGLLLLRRNHVVAWLTVTPLLAFCLPFVVIPFANAVAQRSVVEILTFHRLLLAIPSGLAMICVGARIANRRFQDTPAPHGGLASNQARAGGTEQGLWSKKRGLPALSFELNAFRPSPFSLLLVGVTALTLVPAGGPYYSRVWHLLSVTPQDLQLRPVIAAAESAEIRLGGVKHLGSVATGAVANVLNTIAPRRFPYSERFTGKPLTESFSDAVAIALSGRSTPDIKCATLTRDPLAADPSAWTTLGGSSLEFVSGIKDFRVSTTALQNPPGRASTVFTSDLIPIDPAKTYRVEFSVRQYAGTRAIAYLAVAWYDDRRRPLVSIVPAPSGAGDPVGWANGTYSYFGLVSEIAPTTWTTYVKTFGSNETAAIPLHARFVKVGALLNYNATPAAAIQLTNVRLWRKLETETIADGTFSGRKDLFIFAPSNRMVWSFTSQAAQMSRHWPAPKVPADLGGGAELAAAARAAGYSAVDPDGMIFELDENEIPTVSNR